MRAVKRKRSNAPSGAGLAIRDCENLCSMERRAACLEGLAVQPDGVRPLPPLAAAGSESIEEFNRATEYLNKLIYGNQEYFMVGRK